MLGRSRWEKGISPGVLTVLWLWRLAGIVPCTSKKKFRSYGCFRRNRGCNCRSPEQYPYCTSYYSPAWSVTPPAAGLFELAEVEYGLSLTADARSRPVHGLIMAAVDNALKLVEDVAVQEAEQGAVDVQGVGPAEPGPGEQGQDVLQRAQDAQGAQPERAVRVVMR
jgi:hypothetical protein